MNKPTPTTCATCPVRLFPPCGENIPCCQCKRDDCNSRQPCPKKGGRK